MTEIAILRRHALAMLNEQWVAETPPEKVLPEQLTSIESKREEPQDFSRLEKDAWDCRHCGGPLTIEAVEPIRTHWHCDGCQVSGVTPASLKLPPADVTTHSHACSLLPLETGSQDNLPLKQIPDNVLEAMSWLEQTLVFPRSIADVLRAWDAPLKQQSSFEGMGPQLSARHDLLCSARRQLGVLAYDGPDGRFWWRIGTNP